MSRKNKQSKRKTDRASRTAPTKEDLLTRPSRRGSNEPITPQTDNQGDYMDAINESRIIFGIGPAGTGKTWLPAAMAADALDAGQIDQIILTRPAVEAGENLGFLPGDLKEKYAPYMDPFIDALEDRLGTGHVEYLVRKGIISPQPLAFMRGKTFKNAWVLVDEAQNLTKSQMKMVLTRLGEGSKMIVSGDFKQSDIQDNTSGLLHATQLLRNIDAIETIQFGIDDIVRDDIVMDIVRAYEG